MDKWQANMKEWRRIKAKARKFNKLADKALRKPESADWFLIWKKAYELRKMIEAMPLYSEFNSLQDYALHIAEAENFAGRLCGQVQS